MNYFPHIFETIARQLVAGEHEQYLYASADKLSVMFPSDILDDYLRDALALWKSPVAVLQAEYNLSPFCVDCVFADGATGLIDVDGVAVEFSVRKLDDERWRVFFAQVDAPRLYLSLSDRMDELNRRVRHLEQRDSMASVIGGR